MNASRFLSSRLGLALLLSAIVSLTWAQPQRRHPDPTWLMPPVEGPGLSYHTFDSQAAGEPVSYLLYLPPGYESSPEQRYPVVYWLHGIGGSQRGVPRITGRLTEAIEAGKTPPMIMVFVNGMIDSFYCDAIQVPRPVETVFIEELIPLIDATLRTRPTREGRMIEGFSMGGFGAGHYGFKYPELFGSVSMLDGALVTLNTMHQRHAEILARVFDNQDDLFTAAHPQTLVQENIAQIRGRTLIRQAVGVIKGPNRSLHEMMESLGLAHRYVETGARHNPNEVYEKLGEDNWAFYREAFASPAMAVVPAAAEDLMVFTHTVGWLSHEDQLDNIRDVLDRNDRISGVSIRTSWSHLAPAPDQLDLTSFEALMDFLRARDQKIVLNLQPGGRGTPAWVKEAGAAVVEMAAHGVRSGSEIVPAWDPVYMREYEAFLRRLAPQINADEHVYALAILGHNVATEMHMPGGPENLRRFEAAGLTPEVFLANWQHYIDLYAELFPDKKLILTLSNSYPGYNDLTAKVAAYAVEHHADQLVLKNMQLHGRYEYLYADNSQDGSLVAYRDQVPTCWETVGSFHFQGVRQGTVEMTVFNMLKANPLFVQLWNRDAYYDPSLAGQILAEYEQQRTLSYDERHDLMVAGQFYKDPADDEWANNREELFRQVKANNAKVEYLQKYRRAGN